MVVVVEQDVLGLQQLSPKLICICNIIKYGKLHYSTWLRVLNGEPSSVLDRNAPTLTKYEDLGLALKGNGNG